MNLIVKIIVCKNFQSSFTVNNPEKLFDAVKQILKGNQNGNQVNPWDANNGGALLATGSAKDYTPFLLSKGFNIENSTDYTPIKGDIAVFESFMGTTKYHEHGHIQMYNGTQWVSDFKQKGFWPGTDYRKFQPSFTILRW